MWIIIFGIICELIIGAYTTYWVYEYTSYNKWVAIIIAFLTITICLGTWNILI